MCACFYPEKTLDVEDKNVFSFAAMYSSLARDLGIETPLFAFSYRPEVVAAVTNAGGMGVLGALRFTAEGLDEALTWIDKQVGGRPYGVDVVLPASSVRGDAKDQEALQRELESHISPAHRDFVERVLERFGVPPLPAGETAPRSLLSWTEQGGLPQVEVALAHPISLIANALGPPPDEVVRAAHAQDVLVAALAGSVDHAKAQRERGVDIVVAQGTEAGGHTGDIAGMVLIPQVVDAVSPAPVLAAGGIAGGRQAAAAMALGAQGVWTGSVWLTTAEHELHPVVRQKLLAARAEDAVKSRSLTGKPARMLRTAWTEVWESAESPGTLPMPLQYLLTAEAQERIRRAGAEELLGTPIGQVIGLIDEIRPVADVVEGIVREFGETVARLGAMATTGTDQSAGA